MGSFVVQSMNFTSFGRLRFSRIAFEQGLQLGRCSVWKTGMTREYRVMCDSYDSQQTKTESTSRPTALQLGRSSNIASRGPMRYLAAVAPELVTAAADEPAELEFAELALDLLLLLLLLAESSKPSSLKS